MPRVRRFLNLLKKGKDQFDDDGPRQGHSPECLDCHHKRNWHRDRNNVKVAHLPACRGHECPCTAYKGPGPGRPRKGTPVAESKRERLMKKYGLKNDNTTSLGS